jgi:Fe-S cluster biogenesis protein NfuA/nitrite reductase/ring-hydroxylating ferredoxin subunit
LRAQTEQIIQALMELHGIGISQMMDIIWEEGAVGEAIIREKLPQDDLINALLLMHNLHPLHLADRVQGALDKVRPYMQSHGGEVEVLSVEDGIVRLKLGGSCDGCASSAMTMKYAVEKAIFEAAPDVVEVIAVGLERPTVQSIIALDSIGVIGQPAKPIEWQRVEGVSSLPLRTVHIRELDEDLSVLFCRLDTHLYAYRNRCPHCDGTLEAAEVSATTLLCPTCGQTYDLIRAGRGLEKPDLNLSPIPLMIEPDHVKLAVPASTYP